MPTDARSGGAVDDLAMQVANAFLKAFGDQPGFRLAHAKGIVCHGTFVPSPAAAGICKAEHFRGAAVPVVVRFSDGTGLPNIPDNDVNGNPKGMAVRFMNPDGRIADIVANGMEGFVASTPAEFLAFFQAVLSSPPDGPKPSPLENFLGAHPATAAFLGKPNPTPASFATQAYFGNNSFIFTKAQGQSRAIRYQIIPVAGEKHLDNETAAKQPANFLMDEIRQRLSSGPAEFKLIALGHGRRRKIRRTTRWCFGQQAGGRWNWGRSG